MKKEVIYLMRYNVNYTSETKLKVFKTFEEATKFHENYKHHILNNDFTGILYSHQPAFITHFEILALDLDFIQTVKTD